jgi:DNA-directed RNA polymerase subunit delta
MLETAIGVMKRKRSPQPFIKIYEEVVEELAFTEEQKEQNIARFYSDLSLSAYFIYTGDNNWDLKERQPTDMWDKDASFFIDPEELKARKAERAEKRAQLRREKAMKDDMDLDNEVSDDNEDDALLFDDADDELEEELQFDDDELSFEDDDDIDDSEIDGLDIEDIDEEEIDLDEEDDYEAVVDDYEDLYEDDEKK